jgi:cytidylate kinase
MPKLEIPSRQDVEECIKQLDIRSEREKERIRNYYGYDERPASDFKVMLKIVGGAIIGAILLYAFAFLRGM